jgi:peptidoglycan/LPS O-acetylase OafA/YrhL
VNRAPLPLVSRVLLGLLAAIAGVALVGAVVLAVGDLSSHEDEWDGLGVALALMAGVPALVVGTGALVALRLARRRPDAARGVALALGGLLAAAPVVLLGSSGALVSMVALLPGGLLAVSVLLPSRQPGDAR